MIPNYGKVPDFSLKIPGPIIALIVLILIVGPLRIMSLCFERAPGDLNSATEIRLWICVTIVAPIILLILGTARWWYKHLWGHTNSQTLHKKRIAREKIDAENVKNGATKKGKRHSKRGNGHVRRKNR